MSSDWDEIEKALDKVIEEGKYLRPENNDTEDCYDIEDYYERRYQLERGYQRYKEKRDRELDKRENRIIYIICFIVAIMGMCLALMITI